ncbi:sensor histidine kinase [Aliiglaciecola lipolytica]|uniref:Two-component system, NarL family, sensor histidine kinase DesK n=1 Tax=Aliiglaciecola lipolytica E3 TaxID=1127673 RepID=K6Y4R9_9ALTE|nr:sensor histidine kinase [Aliiglaciecola lipolytica]GAC13242.1 two-component system, NarL family, sensor histidine kinase DesK [Aliiglaciecola lipolytica E3]
MATASSNSNISLPALGRGERRKWSFISLFFSFFYFIPLFVNEPIPNTQHLFASFALYVIFVAFYLWSVFSNGKGVVLPITGLLLACIGGTLLNFGGLFLFGFATFLIGYHANAWARIVSITVVLGAMVLSVMHFDSFDFRYLIPSTFSCLALFAFGLLERKEAYIDMHKQHAAAELAQVSAIAERERIGRDLHDLVGHTLSTIALKAELAEKLLQHNRIDEAKTQLAELSAVSRDVLSDVRKAVSGMKKLSLKNELQTLAKLLENANIDVSLTTNKLTNTELPVSIELQMAFIAKEAVTNILRHSQATKAYIEAFIDNNLMTMRIGDNGAGSNTDTYKAGNGITGMQERLDMINGTLRIKQSDGMHIEVSAAIPFA